MLLWRKRISTYRRSIPALVATSVLFRATCSAGTDTPQPPSSASGPPPSTPKEGRLDMEDLRQRLPLHPGERAALPVKEKEAGAPPPTRVQPLRRRPCTRPLEGHHRPPPEAAPSSSAATIRCTNPWAPLLSCASSSRCCFDLESLERHGGREMAGMGEEEADGRERIGGGARRPLSSIGEEEIRPSPARLWPRPAPPVAAATAASGRRGSALRRPVSGHARRLRSLRPSFLISPHAGAAG